MAMVEILTPGSLGKLLSMENRRGLLRLYGFRELAAGVGLLAGGPRAVQWLWNRVGGDVMDLVTLGSAMPYTRSRRRQRLGAIASTLGITALDLYESLRYSRVAKARELAALS
jgi:hypothetical protein